MITVYGDILSGNCYKIKMLLEFLGLQYQWTHINILARETHTEAFKRLNPNTRIPVVDFGDGKTLWESNAILSYLAEGTDFLPQSRWDRAKVLQWMFFEQYSHEPYIATARYINKYLGLPKEREAEYHAKQAGGHKALAIMNEQLSRQNFLVGESLSIADIALYAYTKVADEGGFELSAYAHILRWFDAIEKMPAYVAMHSESE